MSQLNTTAIVLTATQLEARQATPPARRVRSLPSLEHQYRAYLMQRIEDYKDSISRSELLKLGDEAARDLQGPANGQLLLTEMLMQETVDQQIIERLKLPSYRKWRSKILPQREAQRAPTHWGLSGGDPVSDVSPRLEPGDRVLVIGGGAEAAVYMLAAHDTVIQCLVSDSATATKLEGKLAGESLSGQCDVFVVMLGQYFPPALYGPFDLVVIDAAALNQIPRERQRALVLFAQQRTAPEGLHAVVSADAGVAPEGCLIHYQDWQRLPPATGSEAPKGQRQALRGVLLSGPPIPSSGLTSLR